MSKGLLEDVIKSKPLRLPTTGGEEAQRLVAELAQKQSEAKQEAADFSPSVGHGSGVSCSFTFNPVADTVNFESSNSLEAQVRRSEIGFKVTIRFS